MNGEIVNLLRAAIECSIYVNPKQPGLTYEELMEVGRRANYLDGEISDAVGGAGVSFVGQSGIFPDDSMKLSFQFIYRESPNYKNIRAFDFIISELINVERAQGAARAALERTLIVNRGVAAGIPENDLEVAITCQKYSDLIVEKDGVIRFRWPNASGSRSLPSKQLQNFGTSQVHPKPYRAKAYPIVKELLSRRTDGRGQYAEPVHAFAERLGKIGYGKFNVWWAHLVSELKLADTNFSPVSVCVLAAALVEGALTFAARYARDHGMPAFKSSNFDGEPKSWKIEKLVESAFVAGILNAPTKSRADNLILFRQRIHAGRMLTDYPGGVPELQPEQSRDAKATADLVVRSVIEWLDQNQSSSD